MPETENGPEGRSHEEVDAPPRSGREPSGSAVAAARMRQQSQWVDLQVKQAMERGEFDDLPGQGKPIEGLGGHHDPDWWLKKLVEREKVSVLPPALELRKEDLLLDDVLDEQSAEKSVRRILEDFNRRILNARRQLEGGPPVITKPRDVEAELGRWRERRTARHEEAARAAAAAQSEARAKRRRWWRRG